MDLVGRCLPEYEIVRVVGAGSMGVVFEAVHRPLQRRVALKVLPPGLAVRERMIHRFLREAEVVARIHHENIVPIYDVGSRSGLHYLAMRLVPGVSLDRVVSVAPLAPAEVAKIGSQVARALACAHSQGIVHRDVKPANLLREPDGRVALTDFGLARAEGNGTMTESGAAVGTPNYMSPEQVIGTRESVDGRSDIYSLGATLFELLAGRPPFREATTTATLRAILEKSLPRLRRLRPDAPQELEVILEKAMRKDPAARYANAAAMADDLDRYLRGEPILARPEPWIHRTGRYVKARKGVFIAGGVAVVLAWGAWAALQRAWHVDRIAALDRAKVEIESMDPADSATVDRVLATLAPAFDDPDTRTRACIQRSELAKRTRREQHLRLAMNDTNELLTADPRNIEALVLRSEIAYRLGDMSVSRQCAYDALRIDGEDPRTLTQAARLCIRAGEDLSAEGHGDDAVREWTTADDFLKKAIANATTEETSCEAHLERATTLHALKRDGEAQAEFETAKKLGRQNRLKADVFARYSKFKQETDPEKSERAGAAESEIAKALDPFLANVADAFTPQKDKTQSLWKGLGESFRGILGTSRPASQPTNPAF
ncbi:MAG TPA: serine/threonine-protein kinase [Planctomycetota bacterium]|nr:serine/threonine-protein kinase [Planctomycetota bacterium]